MPRSSPLNWFLDPDVLNCLIGVMDPEVGVNVVDLGLVYHASRTPQAIDVAITMTTRTCPLGEMIAEEARERLADRFQDISRISVDLVWSPPWTPDLISAQGLELLGRPWRKTS